MRDNRVPSQPPVTAQRPFRLPTGGIHIGAASRLGGFQHQLGGVFPMRPCLRLRPQQTDKTRCIFQRRQLNTRAAGRLNRAPPLTAQLPHARGSRRFNKWAV